MTHILIPISLLEKRIELAQKEDDAAREAGFPLAAQSSKCRASVYNLILKDKTLKQISLTEEDIEKKAEAYCEAGTRAGFRSRKEGYKQALQDLTK